MVLPRSASSRWQRPAPRATGERRRVLRIDQPEPPPPDRREPGARRDGRATRHRRWSHSGPAVKPRGGGTRIEPASVRQVLSPVLQNVDESVPNLARRPERPRVVALGPHAPTPTLRPDGLRPAPGRHPPQVRGRSSSWTGRGILIKAHISAF